MGLAAFANAADEDGGVAKRKKTYCHKKAALETFFKGKGTTYNRRRRRQRIRLKFS
jgi:hypothetical protein